MIRTASRRGARVESLISRASLQQRGVAACIFGAAVAGAFAASASSDIQLPLSLSIPTGLLLAASVLGVLAVVSVRNPLIWFAAMLIWFPVGDLLRKLGTGDPRIAAGRDLLLLAGTAALLAHTRLWSSVTRSMRGWWPALIACAGFFVVTAARSGLSSWAIPLSGLHLYFGFFPLLFVGWFIAQDDDRLARAMVLCSTVLSVGTVVGIYQALVGPSFLAPTRSQDFFSHLDLVRLTNGQTGAGVFQPTGPFAEPGRFANWALVTFIVGLAMIDRKSLGAKRLIVVSIGAAGVLIASGRTVLITSALIPMAVVAGREVRKRIRVQQVVAGTLLIVLTALVVRAAFPGVVEPRVEFLTRSLNPFSAGSEISTRPSVYLGGTSQSIGRGGLLGRGVGDQSLGRQYFLGDQYSSLGEGGFSTIALETGLVGLALWLWWTASWCLRLLDLRKRVDAQFRVAAATVAFASMFILFVKLWLGVSAVQDYVLNAFLFGSWGIVIGLAARSAVRRNDPEPGAPEQDDVAPSKSAATR